MSFREEPFAHLNLTLLPESVYLQVTGPSGHFREEAAPVMSPYPQAASSLVVRPPDLQRWPDYTYLVATRTTEPALTLSRTKAAAVPEKRGEGGAGE